MQRLLTIAVMALGEAVSANATVTYFYQVNGGSNRFQYTAPAFLSGPADVPIVIPAASMDFCHSANACTEVDFYPSGRTADDPAHQPEFIIGDSSFGLCCKVFVPFGSFGAAGNYLASNSSPSNPPSDTWTVTDNSVVGSAPEPGSFYLLAIPLAAVLLKVLRRNVRV